MADYFVDKNKKRQLLKSKERQTTKYWIGLIGAYLFAAFALMLLLQIWFALKMPRTYAVMLSFFILAAVIVIIEFIIMGSRSKDDESFVFRDRERISISEKNLQYTYFPTKSCTTTLCCKGEDGEYVVTEQLFDRVDIIIDLNTLTRAVHNDEKGCLEIEADYTIYNSRIDTGNLVTSKRITGPIELYDYFEDMSELSEVIKTHVSAS
ncbi:MAG: hypothetical protein E7472_02480 [Ruminococcaceae bacterium]|nr:hypothetical protein [Oscillospiraceae bacterium]